MAEGELFNQEHLLTRSRQRSEKDNVTLLDLLKGCLMCCYLICPPTPGCITRKIAFHPPEKGRTYTVCLEDGTKVNSASKCFTLRTANGNDIIVIRCSPEHAEKVERLSRMVIIFSQPNASDLGEYLQPFHLNIPLMAELFETDVYAFDYSGFGYSTGTVSERNIYADIRAVFDYIRKTRSEKKIILLGYSIGTAAVADLAASNPEGLVGVIMVAPFTSGLRLFGRKPAEPNTSKLDRFITYDKMPKVNVPVLVCHGAADEAIPMEHGLVITKRAPRAVTPLFIQGADHMSVFNGKYLQTFRRIRKFMDEEVDNPQESRNSSNT